MIDLYCERLGPGLWAEPLNAFTNLAFLIAALASWRLIRRSGARSGDSAILVTVLAFIGIGSALFHTFATTWARVLDVVPILIFQLSFFWLYLRKVIIVGPVSSGLGLGCFLIAGLFGRQFPAVLNGSLTYAPAFVLLICLGVYHFKKRKLGRITLLVASGLFLFALTFRSIDLVVCPYFPVGTHFLWHMLNAVVLYLAMRSLVLNWHYSGDLSGRPLSGPA